MKFKHMYLDRLYDLRQAVNVRLDGSDFERGAIEELQATVSKQADFIATLVEMLVDKTALDLEDVAKLVGMELVREARK